MSPLSCVKMLLLVGQVSALLMDPMRPCGIDCDYDQPSSRLSCTDLSLTCIPKPCCMERTRVVDLSMNNITTIGPIAFQSFPNLHSLDVRRNSIESLSRWAFQGLRYLQILDLRENKLSILRSGIFEGLLNMKTLTLSRNRINDIQPGTFRLLPNLKTLRLNHNLLQVVYPDTFAQLTELVTLDLSYNNIHTVYYGSFNTLANLEFLSMASNKLASLPVFLEPLDELDHLNLKGNPLFCDCSLESVRQWFRERDISFKKSGVCSQPEEFKNQILASIDSELLCESFDESVYDTSLNSVDQTTPREESAFEHSFTHKYEAIPSAHPTINGHTVNNDVNENTLDGMVADSRHFIDLTPSHKDFPSTNSTISPKLEDTTSSRGSLATNVTMSSNIVEESNPTSHGTTVSPLGSPQGTYDYSSSKSAQSFTYTPGANFISFSVNKVKLHSKSTTDSPVSRNSNAEKVNVDHFLADTDLVSSGQTINASLVAGGGGTFQSPTVQRDPSGNREEPAKAPVIGYLDSISKSPKVEESKLTSPTPEVSYSDGFTTTNYALNPGTFMTSLENGSIEADMVKYVMMGESVELECPLSHLAPLQQYLFYYRTKWLSPSGRWIEEHLNRFTVSRQGFLTITDVNPSDDGIYRCARAQYLTTPSIASVELRVSCPCHKIPEMKYLTDELITKEPPMTILMTSLRQVVSHVDPEGGKSDTQELHCNRVPVAVAVLITFQATVALCVLTFCAYVSWRSSQNGRRTNRPESCLERPRTVSEVNYYDSGEPLNRTSEVPTIVYESTGEEEVVEENNVADSSESDSALSTSGSHRNSAFDSEYVNAKTLTRDRSSTYADLDPHSRTRHDTYSSLHREDEESPE